jgi:hypothetical protein
MDHHIIIAHIEASAHHFIISMHKEGDNTKATAAIIKKYVETGHITHEEENALKLQMEDTLKIVGIVVPFVLIPGASIIIPILVKVAGKHNINLMPSVM